MPIYAYKCSSCGFAQDVLQKVSDAPLTSCPQCNAETLAKQVTAAGFQLRGSGWYATDFKNGSGKATSTSKGDGAGESRNSDKADKGSDKADKGSDKADKGQSAGAEKTTTAASGSCGHGGCSACS
ncbi:MAG: zinc ribbon domain-containing protein [Burkholderiaceae bacterium]|nr:zinc ribbon domain-containing protein [Burkholderiaceae bacterium]